MSLIKGNVQRAFGISCCGYLLHSFLPPKLVFCAVHKDGDVVFHVTAKQTTKVKQYLSTYSTHESEPTSATSSLQARSCQKISSPLLPLLRLGRQTHITLPHFISLLLLLHL